jgi:hypothetical protein
MHKISTAGAEVMLEGNLYGRRGSAFELSGSTAGEGREQDSRGKETGRRRGGREGRRALLQKISSGGA